MTAKPNAQLLEALNQYLQTHYQGLAHQIDLNPALVGAVAIVAAKEFCEAHKQLDALMTCLEHMEADDAPG